MATLLPNGEQVFLSNSGIPLALGSVYFYTPNTLTPKDTFQDASGNILNTNPVVLDAAGRAIIYGTGTYRQRVFDADGNLIWDQITASTASGTVAWGGVSTGTADVQVIAASSFAEEDGQLVGFIAGLTNDGALTITPGSGGSPIAVLKDTLQGPVPCTGGEVTDNNAVLMIYEQARGAFHLVEYPIAGVTGSLTDLAGGTTIDLGTIPSQNINVTTSGWTATSFGSSAAATAPIYYLTFAGTGTLTYNATSLILPGAASIAVLAGDTAIAMYLGSGNWRIIVYTRASQPPSVGYKYLATQVFTVSGTYTPTAGTRYIRARLVGGGGGGGGVASASGDALGGGGGGSGADTYYNAAVPAAQTVTIGAGGTAGSASGTDGGDGGTTSLGALATAPGGTGGEGANAGTATATTGLRGGPGGVQGTGTIRFEGHSGTGALGINNAASGYGAIGGTGGGSGGRGGAINAGNGGASSAGFAGRPYGGGGGGAAATDTSSSAAGGAGAAGILIVDEYN